MTVFARLRSWVRAALGQSDLDRRMQVEMQTHLDLHEAVDVLQAAGYDGFINIEYIWVDWKRLNEVDVLSETVMLRDRLNAKFRGERWTYPGPTGITES